MIIGIDIDDTLSYLYNFKVDSINDYIKTNNLPYKFVNENGYLLTEMFDWDIDARNKFWWDYYNAQLINAPVHDNASVITHKLSQDGHTIILVTARSEKDHIDPYAESEAWLKKHNIYYDKLITHGSNKGAIAKENNIDVFIDDYLPNIESLLNEGIKPVIFNARHNINYENELVKRVNTWDEFYNYINEIK